MKYDRCCVDCAGIVDDLNEMIDDAIDITYRTMLRNCPDLQEWARLHGYDHWLPLSKCWHTAFKKSTFQGQPCYFLQWSGIEYIWTPNGQGLLEDSYGAIS